MSRWMPGRSRCSRGRSRSPPAAAPTSRRHRRFGRTRPPVVGRRDRCDGELTISQWPLYIDPGKRGTIAEFEETTGVDVKYVEEINDNNEFFGKLRPLLERGDTGGRSLITVSDWLAARMYKLGYLQRFDYSRLPNVKQNLHPSLRASGRRPASGSSRCRGRAA